MRLFVAVEIDEVVRRNAARVSATLAAAVGHGRDRRSVSWVATQNLHLTLRFLGEVDASAAQEVVDRLAPPIAVAPFDATVAGIGTFPASGPPRVVWIGVADGAAQLSALHREVSLRLEGLGLPDDARPFHAHLTLGRIKAPCGPRLRDGVTAAKTADAGRCRVDHVTLFESRLLPGGAVYSVVATSPLRYHHRS